MMILIPLTAMIPLIVGFIWYNPKVFGTAWMNASGLTEDKLKGGNMALIMGLTYFFSLMLAMVMAPTVIHQFGFFSMINHDFKALQDTNSEVYKMLHPVMERYMGEFRTFGHGALHGGITAIFLVMPIVAINALFERKGFKYIAIHVGYWFISLLLMGGIICQFLVMPS